MNKGLIFFICACFIIVLSIINLSVGPIVTGKVGKDWGKNNCAKLVDDYDIEEERIHGLTHPNNIFDYKVREYTYEWPINECKRKKAMHDMEYTSFIFNIFIGFSCGLIALLHLLELNPNFISKTGLIGLISGIVGFILTFIYVVYNGIVFTNYYDVRIPKLDSDGAFAVHDGGSQYKCIYYDEDKNIYALYAKFSDLNKAQYNYDKKLVHEQPDEVANCWADPNDCDNGHGYVTNQGTGGNNCDKLYIYHYHIEDDNNKDKGNRFLTTLILSIFICIAHLGLALFGFLLFKTPGDFIKIEETKA